MVYFESLWTIIINAPIKISHETFSWSKYLKLTQEILPPRGLFFSYRVTNKNGIKIKVYELKILYTKFRKKGCIIIVRLKNFTLSIFVFKIFQVVTSWLDAIMNPFLHIVDDGFCEFWSDAWYLLANSFCQLGISLWIIFLYYFHYVTL